MNHTVQTRYPITPARLLKVLTDKNFYAARLDALGTEKYIVLEHSFDGGRFSIRIQREVPIQAPALLKRLVPVQPRVTSVETWNVTERSGAIEVDAQGMPVDMNCEMTVTADGKQSVITYHWHIRAKVPLMRTPIEKFIAGDVDKRASVELRAALSILDRFGA